MRKLLFTALLLMAGVAYGSGPKWTYPESPKLDDEINNIYHDIKAVPNGVYKTSSMTLQGITVDSITVNATATLKNLTVTGTVSGITGRILQVITATTALSTTVTGTTYGATNLTGSITPTSTSSRILVLVVGNIRNSNNAGAIAMASIFRGSTDLGGTTGLVYANNGNANQDVPASMAVYDAPASASAVTYTVKIKSDTAGQSALWDTQGSASQLIMIELG